MTRVVLTWSGAYVLGCFSSAYYLVRWRTGCDVRTQGSGAAGATNAARLLGRYGFVAVLLLDAAKGALAVGLAHLVGLDGWDLAGTVLAVTVGHVWPFQLGFRGGRGVAPAIGALLAYAPVLTVVALGFAGAGGALFRKFDAGGVVGLAAGAVVLLFVRGAGQEVVTLSLIVLLLAFTHRWHLAGLLRP